MIDWSNASFSSISVWVMFQYRPHYILVISSFLHSFRWLNILFVSLGTAAQRRKGDGQNYPLAMRWLIWLPPWINARPCICNIDDKAGNQSSLYNSCVNMEKMIYLASMYTLHQCYNGWTMNNHYFSIWRWGAKHVPTPTLQSKQRKEVTCMYMSMWFFYIKRSLFQVLVWLTKIIHTIMATEIITILLFFFFEYTCTHLGKWRITRLNQSNNVSEWTAGPIHSFLTGQICIDRGIITTYGHQFNL